MTKRLFDLLVAAGALLVLSPLLAAAALAVKTGSPGPVFFRQTRVGRGGKTFRLRKFRTMRHDHADGPQVTAAGDARITKQGRWLRRWKIDELPQLLHVVSGEMSLVGPRPEVPRYVERWPADLRPVILSVRPGLTDPATLRYLDEENLLARAADPERLYVEEILPAKAALYADYVRHRTFAGDLALLGTTVANLFWRRRPEAGSLDSP